MNQLEELNFNYFDMIKLIKKAWPPIGSETTTRDEIADEAPKVPVDGIVARVLASIRQKEHGEQDKTNGLIAVLSIGKQQATEGATKTRQGRVEWWRRPCD